jgi:DNA modification methylase
MDSGLKHNATSKTKRRRAARSGKPVDPESHLEQDAAGRTPPKAGDQGVPGQRAVAQRRRHPPAHANPASETSARHQKALEIQTWPLEKLVPYAANPRKNDAAVARMCDSIRHYGFKIPCLVRSDGELIDGHLRLKAARKLGLTAVPVILCDEWTPEQVKAFRPLVNRSATWAAWDEELVAAELAELQKANYDLSQTGFDSRELDNYLVPDLPPDADIAPPVPRMAVTRPGDVWLCGPHRVLCGDATDTAAVGRLLGKREPFLLVTDPPYGIGLDSEWRDRAGLNSCGQAEPSYLRKKRTEGHQETSISGDTRADWSEAFALVPSLQVGYVWHASRFTREVLDGLLRIGFIHHQQIIWDKQRTVLTRTHYWFQHEPCWYVRKVNAAWYGKAGENSTIWASPSPKFIMGGSDETKFDHPTQKPMELMRRPILNHTKHGELVYDPFLGSGTTLAAAELTQRVCCGLELDAQYVDVVVQRWQQLSGQKATLEGDGRTFDLITQDRQRRAA